MSKLNNLNWVSTHLISQLRYRTQAELNRQLHSTTASEPQVQQEIADLALRVEEVNNLSTTLELMLAVCEHQLTGNLPELLEGMAPYEPYTCLLHLMRAPHDATAARLQNWPVPILTLTPALRTFLAGLPALAGNLAQAEVHYQAAIRHLDPSAPKQANEEIEQQARRAGEQAYAEAVENTLHLADWEEEMHQAEQLCLQSGDLGQLQLLLA